VEFAGRTILYTGAAGGLGFDTTLAFLGAGATVVAIDNDKAKTDRLRAAAAAGTRLVLENVDLGDLDALRATLSRLSEAHKFDIVINNAAIYPSRRIEEFTIEEHQRVQRVNVDAGIVCVQAALSHMRRQGWGRTVNVSSITFYGTSPLLAPYVASKAALVGLTRAWARELGVDGITVNAIAPGAFPTDAEKIHPDPEGYTRWVLERQAVKRRGTARDIANALMFLASDRSGFITGQVLNVDGGWVMH
jgi:NAD(P)-dependent dehydrogenase (short-subunit alcohol dehydrogenase family)